MSFAGGGLSLCNVCAKANVISAFAVIFQFITLHLEQIKPNHLQSVTNFGRGRDTWVSLKALLRAALRGPSGEGGRTDGYPPALPAGPQGRRIGPLLPNASLPCSGNTKHRAAPQRGSCCLVTASFSFQGKKSRASCTYLWGNKLLGWINSEITMLTKSVPCQLLTTHHRTTLSTSSAQKLDFIAVTVINRELFNQNTSSSGFFTIQS